MLRVFDFSVLQIGGSAYYSSWEFASHREEVTSEQFGGEGVTWVRLGSIQKRDRLWR